MFDPILNAEPHDYSSACQKKLNDVEDRTRREKDRFRHYGTAREIMDNFKSDLHSSTAKRVSRELDLLMLPTLPSVKPDFLDIAGEQNV